jgi:molybdenum cofactor synthesis domain-containing protein
MCDDMHEGRQQVPGVRTIPVEEAIGKVLAHDITEIRQNVFKGRSFRKGHVVRPEDICHLRRLGKENLFVLALSDEEMHEDDAAPALAAALMGDGVAAEGEPKEGRVTIVAARDGLLKVDHNALLRFNLLGEVMCATLHSNTRVKKGQVVAGTRAIPLVVGRKTVDEAVKIAGRTAASGVLEVRELRKPKAGIVITGNEVYHGRVRDAFGKVITKKIEEFGGEIVGTYFAPDDELFIEQRLRELVAAGADLLITTGGMSVDPDDVTRFAIRKLGATGITYGAACLPGSMFLIAYVEAGVGDSGSGVGKGGDRRGRIPGPQSLIPILGIPACGMYHRITIFDLVLPRVLAGERITRRELAEMGHGGLCLNCGECRFPVCPFGK